MNKTGQIIMPTKSARTVSNVIFFFGIFLGLTLAITVIWAALEAQTYFYTGATYEAFNGLRCPLFLTRSETGTITATFDNPGGQEIQPYYKVETSGLLARRFENQFTLAARESKSVQWTVDANDIDLGSFIFVKLNILPDANHWTRQALCGIFVLNVPGLTGEQILISALLVSLLAIVIGFTLLNSLPDTNASRNLGRAMQALGVSTLAAMLFAFIGSTLAALIFSVAAILLVFIILRFAVA
ncbi:MAG: hypothetical protein HYR70_11170 [Chloroflexi bacterium]|nr:hypothetical protein [Chloroflexota bacterium]MBI1855209.1 hypothetical protein [Chloroflexota bacterium]MBI3340099.1 hypothetical protein [Chloroflexota bacterium]